jgi:hypothetical protein
MLLMANHHNSKGCFRVLVRWYSSLLFPFFLPLFPFFLLPPPLPALPSLFLPPAFSSSSPRLYDNAEKVGDLMLGNSPFLPIAHRMRYLSHVSGCRHQIWMFVVEVENWDFFQILVADYSTSARLDV